MSMHRLLRVVLACVLAFPVTATVGCNTKDEAKPNPELKVPPVPPGRGATGESGAAPTGQKK
jgi:hypothetical protein